MTDFEQAFTSTPQWRSGEAVADYLDRFFRARGWEIKPTTRHEERVLHLGDRHYTRSDEHYLVEYKSGLQTAATGNVFLETVSVDSRSVPGWVYTCRADYLFYATLLNGSILVFEPEALRAQIEVLKRRFRVTRTRKGQNAGYDTHGVIVPLRFAEKLASGVIRLDQPAAA